MNSSFYAGMQHISTNVSRQMEEDTSIINGCAELISLNSHNGIIDNESLESIKNVADVNGFKRMGIVDKNMTVLTTSGSNLDIADKDYIQNAFKGEVCISVMERDGVEEEKIGVISAPVFDGENVEGVVFAVFPSDRYISLLNRGEYAMISDIFIVGPDGDVVSTTKSISNFDKNVGVFDMISGAESIARLSDGIKGNNFGFVIANVLGSDYYVYHYPIKNNKYYLLWLVPSSIINQKSSYLLKYTTVLAAIIVISFIGIFIYNLLLHRRNRKELEELAFKDEVTRIGNANMFRIKAKEILSDSDDYHYAIANFDIDKFKVINDNFGYDQGNRILRGIAEVVQTYNHSFVASARINSDNFALLIRYKTKEELTSTIESFFKDVYRHINEKSKVKHEFSLTMGVFEIYDRNQNIITIMERANIARENNKGYYKSNYVFYTETMRRNLIKEKEIEDDMDLALDNKEFTVVYQPKHSIKTGELIGAEALVRWQHPVRGEVQPGEFIPLFEKNGFVIRLDEFVFEKVCMDIRKWLDEGLEVVPISVNFSKAHLYDQDFVESYSRMLNRYNIPQGCIELEITENLLVDNTNSLVRIISMLNDIGVKISMDDFGSGYSSLNMLKDVPVSCIKLDRIFLMDTMENVKGKQIIEAIVNLSKKIGITVVAEGVETQEQLEFLKSIDCEIAQGFFFDKPLSLENFKKKLEKGDE